MIKQSGLAGLVGIAVAVVALLLGAPAVAFADCNCSTEGQCVYQTCCYMHDDCKPTGIGTYKKCVVNWIEGEKRYTCTVGAECQNGEPCDET